MTVSWLLHLHQPSIQDEATVISISNASYRPLLAILRDNSGFKMTLSVSGTLLEWWQKLAMTDILETLSLLHKRGQIELAGTGFCHPILTLLPKDEVVRQIELEEEVLRRLVSGFSVIPASLAESRRANAGIQRNDTGSPGQARGHCKSLGSPSADGSPRYLRGFFSPEMAISNDLIATLSELGYEWIMADEVAALGRPHFLSVDDCRTKVVIRDRGASLAIAFGYVQTLPAFTNLVDNYSRFADHLVLAMDGETFGHHWPKSLDFIASLASSKEFEFMTISEIVEVWRSEVRLPSIQESTWGTSDDDLAKGVIYPKWKLAGNEIHRLQWELLGLALSMPAVVETPNMASLQHNSIEARGLLDRALGSDQFWWASRNPYWNPGMVKKGAEMLLEVVKLAKPGLEQEKKAEMLYNQILSLL